MPSQLTALVCQEPRCLVLERSQPLLEAQAVTVMRAEHCHVKLPTDARQMPSTRVTSLSGYRGGSCDSLALVSSPCLKKGAGPSTWTVVRTELTRVKHPGWCLAAVTSHREQTERRLCLGRGSAPSRPPFPLRHPGVWRGSDVTPGEPPLHEQQDLGPIVRSLCLVLLTPKVGAGTTPSSRRREVAVSSPSE